MSRTSAGAVSSTCRLCSLSKLSWDQDNIVCRTVPFGQGIRRQVARALAPNRNNCVHPRIECDGTYFDERMPLENELSEDGDGVESSWKHYLALARDASAESDARALEYLRGEIDLEGAELSQNERAIGALEELQQICGSSADVSLLLDKLTGEDGSREILARVRSRRAMTFHIRAWAVVRLPILSRCFPGTRNLRRYLSAFRTQT